MNKYGYIKSAKEAFELCRSENRRIEELESIIMASDLWGALYKQNFIYSAPHRSLVTSPRDAVNYALINPSDRTSEVEDMIATSSEYSFRYAKTLARRFELGEEVIATDANFSFKYARYVIEGRFEKGEAVISQSANYSFKYAEEIIKGRFKLGEASILKFPFSDYTCIICASINF